MKRGLQLDPVKRLCANWQLLSPVGPKLLASSEKNEICVALKNLCQPRDGKCLTTYKNLVWVINQ